MNWLIRILVVGFIFFTLTLPAWTGPQFPRLRNFLRMFIGWGGTISITTFLVLCGISKFYGVVPIDALAIFFWFSILFFLWRVIGFSDINLFGEEY
jgi:hypothetical protein